MQDPCPNCQRELDSFPAGNRDTETMGGVEVEYMYCPICNEHFVIYMEYGNREIGYVYPPEGDWEEYYFS